MEKRVSCEAKKAKVISFINMKGGVGKTTLCVGLGEYLAEYQKKKILLIDMDPQFNATQTMLDEHNLVEEYLNNLRNTKTVRKIFETSTDVYKTSKVATKDEVIYKFTDNFHMILGNINIIFDNNTMDNSRIKRIRRFIKENKLREEYDYIFIDCPPTISIYTDASIMASDYYVVPIKIDQYSILGITNLITVIEQLKREEELSIQSLGVIYTNIEATMTRKTLGIKNAFESEPGLEQLYFFNNNLSFVRDLMVGEQGNIASKYKKSRLDIEAICNEFESRIRGEV